MLLSRTVPTETFLIYGECNKNSPNAANVYREQILGRNHSSDSTLRKEEINLIIFLQVLRHEIHTPSARNKKNNGLDKVIYCYIGNVLIRTLYGTKLRVFVQKKTWLCSVIHIDLTD